METAEPHNLAALNAVARLVGLGVTVPIQQRIGALLVCWDLYEAHLEAVIWRLKKEDVKGVRPSTDKTPVSEWFIELGKGSTAFTEEANRVLKVASQASENLLAYRNSLVHGTLLSFPGASSVSFLRNPRWNGELRRRESGDAHVDENLLDMAIEATWTLVRVVACFRVSDEANGVSSELAKMNTEVDRAKSFAGELRHLTALMNYEKY